MTSLEGVLLDMGGVILDMGNGFGMPVGELDREGRLMLLRRLRQAGASLGLEDLERLLFAPWRAEYERRYDLGCEARWEPHLQRLEAGSGVRVKGLLDAWFGPYAASLRPVAGAQSTLQELLGVGLRLALVSNVPLPGRLYLQVLERYDLASAFSSFHFSYDSASRKPRPEMLHAALAQLAVEPERAVMVGDRRSSDVAAGRAAGMRTVWLRSDRRPGPDPDRVIDSLAELPNMLRECSLDTPVHRPP